MHTMNFLLLISKPLVSFCRSQTDFSILYYDGAASERELRFL